MTFLILKYGKRRSEQVDWRSRGNRCGSKYYRKSSAFFIKPYLTIEAADMPDTENITISVLENPPVSDILSNLSGRRL
jgi:hypothetical protein